MGTPDFAVPCLESLIEAKVILIDRDYVVLEDKNNFGRTDNIAEGKWEDYVDLFGIISFSKKDFYACDTIDCKGKKKKNRRNSF